MTNVQRKTRVILDTNVVVSALIFGGNPRQVTDMVIEKAFRPVMSEELMTELRRVIGERFPKARHELEVYEKLLRRYALWLPLGNHTVTASRDPDNNMVLETAIAGKAKYIVSGDKDLLDLKSYQDISIIKPADFLTQEL